MAVRWAEKHMGDVLDAREAYDCRQGAGQDVGLV